MLLSLRRALLLELSPVSQSGGLQRFIIGRQFLRSRLGSWNDHADPSSRSIGLNAHRPGQLENPFSNPDTRASRLNF